MKMEINYLNFIILNWLPIKIELNKKKEIIIIEGLSQMPKQRKIEKPIRIKSESKFNEFKKL